MHLLVTISPHGFGHTAQIAPVVNELYRRIAGLRVTIRTTVPRGLLAARFDMAFDHIAQASDFGMVMASAVDVLAEPSARRYAEFHRNWRARVNDEAAAIASLRPDLVLANVPYLPLAGAARAGIPSAALCSLNWADIYRHYCGDRPEADDILGEMLDAYRSASIFLRPEPCMPMQQLLNSTRIGPIARIGAQRRVEIDRALGLTGGERLAIVAPGGIPTRWPMETWPRLPGVRWIVQSDWQVRHPDAFSLESLGMVFTDVLRSCDLLVGKPGYGSIAECGCNGTPMLYLKRGDWPEEPYLLEWIHAHGRAVALERSQIERGELAAAMEEAAAGNAPVPVAPTGVDEAVGLLLPLLEQRG